MVGQQLGHTDAAAAGEQRGKKNKTQGLVKKKGAPARSCVPCRPWTVRKWSGLAGVIIIIDQPTGAGLLLLLLLLRLLLLLLGCCLTPSPSATFELY